MEATTPPRIFWGDLSLPVAEASLAALASDEIARAERLKHPLARARFVAGRVFLRSVLAAHIGSTPGDLRFVYAADGKPSLENAVLHFNLAHSDHHAVLALAAYPVGVDVERIREPGTLWAMTPTVFTPSEQTELSAISEERKIFAFFRLWTCKEALMKALGGGFKLAQHISITDYSTDAPVLIGLRDGDPTEWTLQVLPAPAGYAAALAYKK
ncbi:MAG: 4'-phosphopantetheinyl transferase superfamily protein [Armatimonadetes bacterium]|nr:4'-phosphopantetheinyl transferase superfamily protein [Anaerolineae bacterium]